MATDVPRLLEIKKYPNRRLYDATRSCHVTLTELYNLVAAGNGVVVRESRTGEDITNQVLLQALIERDPLKIGAVPSPLIHLMIRLNHQFLASWFDLYIRRMMDAYRVTQGGAPGWWPGWPAPAGAWAGPGGAEGLGSTVDPFAAAAGSAGQTLSPMAWLTGLMPQSVSPSPPTPPGGPASSADPRAEDDAPPAAAEIRELRAQMAALAAELASLRGDRRE